MPWARDSGNLMRPRAQMRCTCRLWVGCVTLAIAAHPLRAQILETETARILKRGAIEVASNFEFQTAKDGREYAVPFAIEFGLGDRLELLIEPVAYTRIRPSVGRQATGRGDIEVTMTTLFARETASHPAIAVAAEVKIPTARDVLIGTGKADVAGYLIASRRFRRLDAHANLGYTIVGQPRGVHLQNIVNGAIGLQYSLGRHAELFGEVLGNTAALAEGDSPASAPGVTVPEAPAGEQVGTIGVARDMVPGLKLSIGIAYDNNGAVMLRPGLIWHFR